MRIADAPPSGRRLSAGIPDAETPNVLHPNASDETGVVPCRLMVKLVDN